MSSKLKKHIEKTGVGKRYVYCSNEIVRVPWNLTHSEAKLLLIILHKVKSFVKNINEEGKYIFYLYKSDIFEKLGLSNNSKYHQYKKVSQGLIMKTVFNIASKNDKVGFCEPLIYDIRWFDYSSNIEVQLNPAFMHFVELLESRYTKIPLKPALKLKSKKSLALFMLLCSYLNSNVNRPLPFISQTQLKYLLKVPEDAYKVRGKPSNSAFRLKVVDPIIFEINSLHLCEVKYKICERGVQHYYQFSISKTIAETADDANERSENEEFKLYAG